MWLVVDYQPIATFELRPSNTTKSGGKSLLAPTPYAVKMALLDRAIRHRGVDYGRAVFPLLRDLRVALNVPSAVAVNRTFQRILRPMKGPAWNRTIAMREFCIFAGVMRLAFETDSEDATFRGDLPLWLASVNYFGQKGSFMQYLGHVQNDWDGLPETFVDLTAPDDATLMFGYLQRMDDMDDNATFDDVSTFNPKAKGARVSYTVTFPYRLAHHGPHHTIYEVP